MRRMISFLLTLVLLTGVMTQALAAVEEKKVVQDAYIYLHEELNVLVVEEKESDLSYLYRADGTLLCETGFDSVRELEGGFEVTVYNGTINNSGVVNGAGVMLVPMQYGDVESLSDRWQLGAVLTEATAENYDYKSFGEETSYYLVDHYDVYFKGVQVGTLGRLDYHYAYARGDYLYVSNQEGDYTYYDKTMTPSAYVSDYASSSEYDDVYGVGYFHRGSGQQAFVPSCTLTADQVETAFMLVGVEIVDLQGNPIGKLENMYESVYDFEGDYARTRINGKYGLIHKSGKEILPCEYDEINYGDETFFEGGYQIVVKDGKVGYVDLNGQVTCEFKYSQNVVDSLYDMPFNTLTDLDGSIIVLSGKAGELPQRFAEVQLSYNSGCPLFVGVVEEGKTGVFDLDGNAVIPADGRYEDTYDFQISADGTVIVGYDVNRVYSVYTVEQQADVGAALEDIGNLAAQVVAQQDGGWDCVCGSHNSGNFCPECGAARPADKLVCTNCGFEPAPGETPKFCSECGNAF